MSTRREWHEEHWKLNRNTSIRKKVSRGAGNRLKAIYGENFITDINLHADSMTVQCFTNSNKKNTALQKEIMNYPVLSENGFKKFL